MKKYKSYILGGSMILLLLLVWQVASDTGIFGKYDIDRGKLMLPSPVFVFVRLIELITNGYLLKHIWISFKRVITGFLIAVLLGFPLGVFMGRRESAKMFIQPLFKILAPIPGVAWVPLSILWFGLGDHAAVFIIAVSAITPIVTNVIQGIESIDTNLENMMNMLKASRWQLMRFLIIPSAVPYVITGFKLGLGYAWRVVIAAEMVGVPDGMGYVLNLGRSTAQTEITFITIIVLAVLLALMEKCLFAYLEKITGAWKTETKS